MLDKNKYQTLLRAKIKSTIEQAKAATTFSHAGVQGAVREILIGGLFKPLLPSDIGVGTGQIIDNYGSSMSRQIDIILYDRSILPPALIDETLGLFPIESVLYTIEVKTTLNATELRAAHLSAKSVSKFGYLPGLLDENGALKDHPIERARSVIFALGSDLTGNRLSEAERYKKLYKEDFAHLRAICVVGRGYWYDNGEHWINLVGKNEYDEVLAFIGGVTNTYKGVSKSRHNPLLGNYVIPKSEPVISIESRKSIRVPVSCKECGAERQFKPIIGKMDLTVNGTITCSDPCPSCGGVMLSAPGTYKFINGELAS